MFQIKFFRLTKYFLKLSEMYSIEEEIIAAKKTNVVWWVLG